MSIRNAHLLSALNPALEGRVRDFGELTGMLDQLAVVPDKALSARASSLRAKIDGFAAKITLVGQVKAGKSALANVLAAQPGLLPSDVNPWTSVVTTLHVNADRDEDDREISARFTFFGADEWDQLMVSGGRLGELAQRTGASDEMEQVQRQVAEMRAATEKRLGSYFEHLLGQSHDYGYIDNELMERYVCLGDGDDLGEFDSDAGRFADVTRSADIFLDIPSYALPMAICDTPGVNDTFMMREQITIRSLRGSEICVVVLSAHQALARTDMALMRLISSFDKRQTVIFVNRIDELQDPASQIPEIRASIAQTLVDHKFDGDVAVVCGSALWAEAALEEDLTILPPASIKALKNYINKTPALHRSVMSEAVWAASGLEELLGSLGQRIAEGASDRLYRQVSTAMRNLANETRAALASRQSGGAEAARLIASGHDPMQIIDEIVARNSARLDDATAKLRADLTRRMEKAEESFVKRATDTLIEHLEQHGEQGNWQYNPAGLRVLQRAAHSSFTRSLNKTLTEIYSETARNLEEVYRMLLGKDLEDFEIAPPNLPHVPPPVGLGKTIALDFQSTWWTRWWKRRKGFEAFAEEYGQLIRAEAQTIARDIDQTQAVTVITEARRIFDGFVDEHRSTLTQITREGAKAAQAMQLSSSSGTQAVVQEILKVLGEDEAA